MFGSGLAQGGGGGLMYGGTGGRGGRGTGAAGRRSQQSGRDRGQSYPQQHQQQHQQQQQFQPQFQQQSQQQRQAPMATGFQQRGGRGGRGRTPGRGSHMQQMQTEPSAGMAVDSAPMFGQQQQRMQQPRQPRRDMSSSRGRWTGRGVGARTPAFGQPTAGVFGGGQTQQPAWGQGAPVFGQAAQAGGPATGGFQQSGFQQGGPSAFGGHAGAVSHTQNQVQQGYQQTAAVRGGRGGATRGRGRGRAGTQPPQYQQLPYQQPAGGQFGAQYQQHQPPRQAGGVAFGQEAVFPGARVWVRDQSQDDKQPPQQFQEQQHQRQSPQFQQQQQQPAFGRSARGGRGGRFAAGRGGGSGGRASPRGAGPASEVSSPQLEASQDSWQHDQFHDASYPPATPSAPGRRGGKPLQLRQPMPDFEEQSPRTPFQPRGKASPREAFTPDAQHFSPSWQEGTPDMRTPGAARSTGRMRTLQGSTVSARFAPAGGEFGYDESPQAAFLGNQALTFHTPPARPKKAQAQQAAMQQATPSPQPSQVWSSEHGMRASTPKQRQQRPKGRQPAYDQAASPAEAFEPSATPSSQHDSWGHDIYEAEAPTTTQRRSRKAAPTPGEQRRKPVSIAHAAAYDEADEERSTALALFPSPDGKNQEARPPRQKQPRGKQQPQQQQQQQQQQRDKAVEQPSAKPGKQALLDRPMPSRGQMKAPPRRSAEEEEEVEQEQLSDSEPAEKLRAQQRGSNKAPTPSSSTAAPAAAPAGSAPMASYGALSTFLKKDYQPSKQASAAAPTTSKPDSEQLSTKPYARKPAKLSDWIAPVDVKKSFADASAMAQCQDMCAERERIRRAAENDLHKLEQEHPALPGLTLADMAIKKYQRSAADHELKIPSEIRPAPVLLKTLEYIEDELMEKDLEGPDPRYGGEPVPSLELYLFIWDRFRMICKDFILQDYRFGGLNDQCCIEVHERIARWYVMMDHQMRADPEFVKAHAQQNAEQLNAVLKSLGSFYDDARKRGRDVAAEWCKHEAEFRSYFLLYQLDNKDVTQAALATLAPEVLAAPEVQLVLEVMKARKYRNYARFFRVFKEADYLHACILFKYVGVMRAEALRLLSRFFLAPKTKTRYPLDELIDLLCFEDEDDALDFLESFGLYVDTSGDEAAVLLEGVNLQHATPPPTRFMENWIEGRLAVDDETRFTRKQVCHGLAKQELVAEDEAEEEAEEAEAEGEEEEEEERELKAADTAAAKAATTTPVVKRSVSKDEAVFSAMSTPTPSSRRSAQAEVQLTPISPLEFSTPRSATVTFPEASFPPNIPKSAVFSIGTSDRPDEGLKSPKVDTPTTPLAARDTASPFPMLQKQPSVEAVKPVALRPATTEFSRAILRDEQLSPSKEREAEPEAAATVSKPAKAAAEEDKAAAIKRGEKLLSLAKRIQLRRALRQWAEYVESRRQELRRCLLTMWFWRWHHLMQLEVERQERHASSLAALEMPRLEPSRRKRQASFDADQEPQVKRGQLLVVPQAEIELPQSFEPVHLAAPDWLYARAVGWSSAEPMRGCVPLPLAQIVAPILYKAQLAAVWQLQEQFGQALNTDEIDWRAKLCWKLLVTSSARFSGQWDSRSSQSVANVVRALLANQDMDSEHAPSTEWIGYWEEKALVQGRGYNAVARSVAVSVRDCASDYRDANDLGAMLLGSQGVLFICSDWVLDHTGDSDPTKQQQQQAEDIDVFGGLLDDLAELGVDLTVLPIHVLVVGTGPDSCVRELTEQEQNYFESAIDLSMLPQPTYSVVLVAESELHDLDSVGGEQHPGWCLSDALLSGVLDALRALAARSPHAPLVERHNICGWLWKLVEQVLVQHVPRADDIAVEEYMSLALFEVASLIEKCERQVRRHIEQPEAFHYPALDFAIDIPAAVEPDFESDVHGGGDSGNEPTFPAVLGALWEEKSQASNFVPVYWNDDKHTCSDELLFALQALTPAEWSSAVAEAHEAVASADEDDAQGVDNGERAALAARVRLQSYLAQLKSMGWSVATECVELLLEACSSNDLSVARQGLLCMFSARLTQMAASYDRTGYLPAETWAVPRPDPEYWRPALQQLPKHRQRKAAALLEEEGEEEKQNHAAVEAAAAVITPSKPREAKRRRGASALTPRVDASPPAAAAAAGSEVVVLDHELPDYDDSDAVEAPAVPRIVHELQHETEEQWQLNAWLQAHLATSLDPFALPARELPPPPQPTPPKRSKRPLPPSSPSPSLPLTGGIATEYLAALEKERKEFDEMMRRLKRGYTLPEPTSTSEKPATDTEDNSDDDRDHGDDVIGEWLGSLLREGRELHRDSEQLRI